jgi:sigma-B regulation protein RsbU (phosphoserine phosphatase)
VSKGPQPYRIACSEIWGGICNVDVDACTSALTASIYSHSCHGGKGGDIYYLSVCDTDRLTRIAVADVVGHGHPVSLVSEWVYDALAARMNNPAGDDLLEDLNRRVIERGLDAMTTAAILSFYRDDSNLYVSYAGHPPLLMRRRGESRWHVAGSTPQASEPNLPLGVQEDMGFSQDLFPVGSGDRLLAYTDGLIEAPDAQRDMFGQRRLLEVLEQAGDGGPADLKRHVLEALRRHSGGPLAHDDVTLLAIEIR